MKVIPISIIACLVLDAPEETRHSSLCCAICRTPHGNLIGNGICLDCNKREFNIRPDGGGGVVRSRRSRR
jgi:hypothetical protein